MSASATSVKTPRTARTARTPRTPRTPKTLRHTKAEQHNWQPWGSDNRFEVCVAAGCGQTRRAVKPPWGPQPQADKPQWGPQPQWGFHLGGDGQMSPNPCVQRWGRGPEGATCKTCVHLKYISQAERSYTCSLRTDLTHAPQWGPRAKSDQRLGWDACKRYRESQPLAGEASKDVSAAELEARGEALNAYLDSFKRAFAEMDARKPLASARGGKTEDGA